MTGPIDPEELVLGDHTDEERRALLARTDAGAVADVERLAEVLSSLEGDDWRAAETPPLRFVPDGAGERAESPWAGLRHRLALSPALAAGVVALVLLAGVAGFALRGTSDAGGPSKAALAEAKLQTAPGISLVRGDAAPPDAGGIARMMGGDVERMMVRAHGIPPVSGGSHYEVWLRGDDGALVSVGRFRPEKDGSIDARFPMRLDPKRYGTAIVTLQTPEDRGAYSGRSVLRSAAS